MKNNNILLVQGLITTINTTPPELYKLQGKTQLEVKESIYIFLSKFTITPIQYFQGENHKIKLNYELLKLNYGNGLLSVIFKVLDYHGIIERTHYSTMIGNSYSRSYYFTSKFLEVTAIREYKLKCKKSINLVAKLRLKAENKLHKYDRNGIKQLIDSTMLTLPTKEQLIVVAKKMVQQNKCNKKGKLYRFANKKSKLQLKKIYRYVEHDIAMYQYAVANAILKITKGGRVSYSLNRIPKWIRNEILINDTQTVELDATAMQPSLFTAFWASTTTTTTTAVNYTSIADSMGIVNTKKTARNKIKSQFIQWLHQDLSEMYKYKIDNYLTEHYPSQTAKIKQDKKAKGAKYVSYKLLELESSLFDEISKEFVKQKIQAIYVYDAMIVPIIQQVQAMEIMQYTFKKYSVNSVVTIN